MIYLSGKKLNPARLRSKLIELLFCSPYLHFTFLLLAILVYVLHYYFSVFHFGTIFVFLQLCINIIWVLWFSYFVLFYFSSWPNSFFGIQMYGCYKERIKALFVFWSLYFAQHFNTHLFLLILLLIMLN